MEKPLWAGALCIWYILVSAGLIDFNKYLMNHQRFPHAMTLTATHMAMSSVLCFVLYMVKPSLYPAMQKTEGKKLQLLKWFVPLGSFFAVGLFASNQAYLYCNVAFLQFMKEANLVIVFLLSCAIGLQVMNRQRLAVIAWIISGASMAVTGEVKFSTIGFFIQAISQLGECSKNVMGEYILSGSDMRLDPLTYTMFMAPVCLAVVLCGHVFTWTPAIASDLAEWWPLLLPNAMLAFVLNVTIATLIKECSAMAFVLAGIVKDMFIVTVSSITFGEYISPQQICGFAITLTGIFFWSHMRIDPDSTLVVLFERILGCDHRAALKSADEEVPITRPEKGRGGVL